MLCRDVNVIFTYIHCQSNQCIASFGVSIKLVTLGYNITQEPQSIMHKIQ